MPIREHLKEALVAAFLIPATSGEDQTAFLLLLLLATLMQIQTDRRAPLPLFTRIYADT